MKYIGIFSGIVFWAAVAYGAPPVGHTVAFENGFTAVLLENHGAPMIGSTIVVRTGSVDEEAANNGVSHMLEHLLFNGTERRTQEALYAEQEQYGIYNNAHTAARYTNYIVLSERDHIDRALDIQSDMLFHSAFPQDKFEKEKGIIINEIARDWTSPRTWADFQFARTFLKNTPYNLPVLGTPMSIRRMSRAQVLDHYRTYYVPNNMTAIVVGDFDRDQMIALLRKYFGTQPPGPLPERVAFRLDSRVFGTRAQLEMAVPSPMVTLGYEAPAIHSPDFYPMSVLTQLARRTLKHKLDEALTQAGKHPLMDLDLEYDANPDFGFVKVIVVLQQGEESESVVNTTQQVLARTASEAIDRGEITRLVTGLKVQDLSLLEKPHYFGMMKADAIAHGGWNFAGTYSRKISMVTVDEIAKAAMSVFGTTAPFVSILTPGKAPLNDLEPSFSKEFYVAPPRKTRDQPSSLQQVKKWKDENLEARVSKETADVIWNPEPSGSSKKQIKRMILKNGLTLLIDSNSDSTMFAVHVLAKHRAWAEPPGKEGIADLLHELLGRGTENLDEESLDRELDEIGATLKTRDSDMIPFDDYYHSRLYSYIRFETIDEFAEQGIRLIANLVKSPRFQPLEIEDARRQTLARIAARESSPVKRSEELLYQAAFPHYPLGRPIEGTSQSVASITAADLKAFHARYFAPENLIVSVATGLPVETIARLIDAELKALSPHVSTKPTMASPRVARSEDKNVRQTLGASQAYIRLGALIPIDPTDRPAFTVMTTFLANQLGFDLRERKGLAYSIGSDLSYLGDTAFLEMYMGTTPQTTGQAFQGLREGLEGISHVPIKQADIERIVNTRNSRALMRRLTRINQAFRSGLEEFLGAHPGWTSPSPEELKAVTAQDVRRMIDKYLSKAEFVKVIVD